MLTKVVQRLLAVTPPNVETLSLPVHCLIV